MALDDGSSSDNSSNDSSDDSSNDSSDGSSSLDYIPFGSVRSVTTEQKKRRRNDENRPPQKDPKRQKRGSVEPDMPSPAAAAAGRLEPLKERAPPIPLIDSDDESIASEDLEIPYAEKALSDDGDSFSGWQQDAVSEKRTEPLRPGDVVAYNDPLFVAGDPRGKRHATVLNTDPNRSIMITLSNGAVLPNHTEVKRVRVFKKGKLYPHPRGLLRTIESFRITMIGSRGLEAGIQQQGRRFARIIEKNVAKARTRSAKDGFAPMDVLHKGLQLRPVSSSLRNSVTASDRGTGEEAPESIESFSDASDPALLLGPTTTTSTCPPSRKGRHTKQVAPKRPAGAGDPFDSDEEFQSQEKRASLLFRNYRGYKAKVDVDDFGVLELSKSDSGSSLESSLLRKNSLCKAAAPSKPQEALKVDGKSDESSVSSPIGSQVPSGRLLALKRNTSCPKHIEKGKQNTTRQLGTVDGRSSSIRQGPSRDSNGIDEEDFFELSRKTSCNSSSRGNHNDCQRSSAKNSSYRSDSEGQIFSTKNRKKNASSARKTRVVSSTQGHSPIVDLTSEGKSGIPLSGQRGRSDSISVTLTKNGDIRTHIAKVRGAPPAASTLGQCDSWLRGDSTVSDGVSGLSVAKPSNSGFSFTKKNRTSGKRVGSSVSGGRPGTSPVPVATSRDYPIAPHVPKLKIQKPDDTVPCFETPKEDHSSNTDLVDSDGDNGSRRPVSRMKRLMRSDKSSPSEEKLKARTPKCDCVEDPTSEWQLSKTGSSRKSRNTYGSRRNKFLPRN